MAPEPGHLPPALLAEPEEVDYESLPETSPLIAHMAAGAFAGIMEHSVMFPIDAIKTRMQVSSSAALSETYSGLLSSITRISASEGLFSLWRGVTSVILGAGPAHAVHFAVYEATKTSLLDLFDKSDKISIASAYNPAIHGGQWVLDDQHPLVTSLAGASAVIASDFLMNPFDVVKQRMQAESQFTRNCSVNICGVNSESGTLGTNRKYKNFFDCAKQIILHEGGIKTFYLSYPTTVIMDIPFSVINFTIYESSLKFLNPSKEYNPLVHCVCGGIAGATAAAFTTPLDVIKTLLQTKGLQIASNTSHSSYLKNVNSLFAAAGYIYRQGLAGPNGGGKIRALSGFFSGWKPRIIANIPSTAISWTCYEMAKKYMIATQE